MPTHTLEPADPEAETVTPTDNAARPASDDRSPRWLVGLLVAATLAMGLIAGFFYAYACSVMLGLADTDDRTFVATMQAINATVRNAAFAPSFFGALVLTAAAAVALAVRRRPPLAWVVGALLFYGLAFAITLGVAVPLNDELAAAGPPDAIVDIAAVRDRYEGPWVRWNIARAVASTIAFASCLVAALVAGRTLRPGATA